MYPIFTKIFQIDLTTERQIHISLTLQYRSILEAASYLQNEKEDTTKFKTYISVYYAITRLSPLNAKRELLENLDSKEELIRSLVTELKIRTDAISQQQSDRSHKIQYARKNIIHMQEKLRQYHWRKINSVINMSIC